ncbi:MAG: enoyl-CoA hydratase-related protein [Pseudomonadota bacterium]
MAYDTIVVDTDDKVATIRLNRPDQMNALSVQMLGELAAAVTELDASDRVRCIVITGNDKAFAAGVDITEMAEKDFVEMFRSDHLAEEARAIERCRTPIIAAVAGYALGGGCELAMMCDIILAADTAKFGQPEVNLGVMAGLGGTQRLTHAIGKAKAMEMHLTGRLIGAEEAERAGLVSRVVPAAELLEDVRETAKKITENSTLATAAIKETVNRSFETGLSEGLLFERRVFHALFATEDQTEGMSAFVDKREPQFRNK